MKRQWKKRFELGGSGHLKTMVRVPAESAMEELTPQLLSAELCNLMEGFDPLVPLRTPQECLRRVQIEAAQCPDVVVAQIDPKKLKRKQSVNIFLSGCQPAPEGYSPTLQWQQQQVALFPTVGQNVNKHRSHWKSQQLDSNVTMPKPEDEKGWKKFSLGEKLCADGAVGQATVESPRVDSAQERWLYALWTCLEKSLLSQAHSLIWQLARCCEVRLLVESKHDEKVPALNLLVCLVSRYLDQCDLADELS
uniref:Gem-associated protein 2 n=1 Tax=Macaca nemestrina TaxID=9545 RepID=A0A2K6C6U8_MACNE